MQFLYDKQVVVKRYSSTLGEFNRPNKTLVEVGTYECHTAESRGLEATEGGKGWLKADSSTMEINVAKQKQYLESIGVDTSEMDEQAIKEANTGSHVFLKGTISILDAIEDVDIFINKD